MSKITIATLKAMKQAGDRFACLTAYDAIFAQIIDEAGVEVLLVGDSLSMVIQGHESTLPVTLDEMIYHTKAVSRGAVNALVMADMPFMSYNTEVQAVESAGRLMKEGRAHIVKLEGGRALVNTIKQLTSFGIPVCAHLGLQPQSVHKLGGYKVQGRDKYSAKIILEDALALEKAGADMVLLECVPMLLAEEITLALDVPVIGIGAGPHCNGQVLVLQDMLGITPGKQPRFTQNFLQGSNGIQAAIAAYAQAIKEGDFPSKQQSFTS
ncbi:MAG: 3-methyl-2-oxobutanoate hydroxymethyltransferase [Gammaproteobacteria bacterium]|nr:3-methyl-2-oxobutanoate hydroxymethyltransferase [Gammaproteobacteria bacterium]